MTIPSETHVTQSSVEPRLPAEVYTKRKLRKPQWSLHDANALSNEVQKLQQHCDLVEKKLLGFQERCEALENDNEQLRAYIATMRNAQGPILDEGYYSRGFDGLRREIDSWVAKQYKKNANQSLSDDAPSVIVRIVSLFGDHGLACSHFLQSEEYSIQMLYNERRTRIPLIRHVIAIILFDQVFDRFAFGLTRDSSDYTQSIEDSILQQSSPY